MCENKDSSVFHVAQIEDIIFQVCHDCFEDQLYPSSIAPEEFAEVLKSQYDQNNRKLMSTEQCCRMLEILGQVGSSRQNEKEAWNILQKEFSSKHVLRQHFQGTT